MDAEVDTIAEKTELSSGEIVPIFNQLDRAGYAQAYGLMLYKLKPTHKGTKLVNETHDK